MNEPSVDPRNTNSDWDGEITIYMEWARENKKRADRLLAAAKAILLDHAWDWSIPAPAHVIELERAAQDYEDKVG